MAEYPKHNQLMPRLRRIEGQVRGVARMVDDGRYCIDIIQQLTAVRRAVDEVSFKLMRGHINSCVSAAIRKREGKKKVDELIQALHRFVK